jgi:hypothetical protein
MGKLLSKIFGNKEMRILMLGLDAAGKTSILYSSLVTFIDTAVSCPFTALVTAVSLIIFT